MASAQRDAVRRGLPGRLCLRPGVLLTLGLCSSISLVHRLSPPTTCGLRPTAVGGLAQVTTGALSGLLPQAAG